MRRREGKEAAVKILGKPQDVITNFLRKEKSLREGNDDKRIRPALIVLGGGIAGVQSAGALRALAEYTPNAPDVCAGVSVGSSNLYGFLSGDADIAPYVYEALVKEGLVSKSVWRFELHFEIDYITRVLRHRNKQQNVSDHRSHFITFATEFSTGMGIAMDAKKAQPDIIEAVRASMMLPGMCSGTVHFDGKRYVDGACGVPFPVRDVIKKYRPTDILILFNRTLPEQMGWIEWYTFPILARLYLFLHGIPRPVRDRTATMDRVMAHEIRLLMRDRRDSWGIFKEALLGSHKVHHRKKFRWCIIAPEPREAISHHSTNLELMRRTSDRSYEQMHALLEACKRLGEKDGIL